MFIAFGFNPIGLIILLSFIALILDQQHLQSRKEKLQKNTLHKLD